MGQRTSNDLHLINVYLLLFDNVSYIFQDAEVLHEVGIAIESLDLARIRSTQCSFLDWLQSLKSFSSTRLIATVKMRQNT